MANSAKVRIEADYRDNTKKGMDITSKAVAGLKSQVGALAAAWGIREVAMFTVEVSKLAATAKITEETFARLATRAGTTATSELQKMRDAVGGTMTDLELMRKVGAAVDAGLTFGQSITALKFLRQYSLAFGKDFNQLVQTIFTGLQRGSVLFLDDAGIILSAQDKMFEGMGDLEKKSALVGEAVRLMSEKMKVLPEIQENAATQADRLGVAWDNVRLAIGKIAEGPTASILEILANAATGAADMLDKDKARPRKEDELRIAAERAKAARTWFGWLVAGDIEIANQIKLMREEGDEIEKLAAAERKRREDEDAAIARLIAATKKRLEWEKKVNDAAAKAAGQIRLDEGLGRLAGEMAANQEIQDAKARARDVADAETEAFLDAESKRLENRQNVLDMVEDLEIRASNDRLKIARKALRDELLLDLQRARAMEATEEQIAKIRESYNKVDAQLRKDNDPVVKQILLVFNADSTQVKTASDLAAYSLGLLVNQLRAISPGVAAAVAGIQQIIVGAKTGGKAGAAGIIGGAVGILGTAYNMLEERAARAAAAVEALKDRIQEAGDAAGNYAKSLESESLSQLQGEFMNTILKLRSELNASGGGIIRFNNELYTFEGHTGKATLTTIALSNELERLEEAIGRFSGAAATQAHAMARYNHELRMTGENDPVEKLRILKESIANVGLWISSATGEVKGAIDNLSLADRWAIEETVAQLQRDITDAELAIRKEQADVLIEGIRQNAERVKDALADQEEAMKQAALRSVRLQYDVQEQALRQSFQSRLKGAGGDPFEIQRIIMEAQSEIALLQLAEQASATAILADIRDQFDAAEDANDAVTQQLIDAVLAAADNTSAAFGAALATEMGKLDFQSFIDLSQVANQTADGQTAILDQLHFTLLDGTSAIAVKTGAVANGVQVLIEATHDVARAVNATATIVPPAIDYGDPDWSTVRGHLDAIRYNTELGWQWSRALFYNGNQSIVDAVNNPAWVSRGLPGGGGSQNTFNINLDVDATGGSVSAEEIEDVVNQSLNGGSIGRTLGEMLRAIGVNTTPSVPSNIRT